MVRVNLRLRESLPLVRELVAEMIWDKEDQKEEIELTLYHLKESRDGSRRVRRAGELGV